MKHDNVRMASAAEKKTLHSWQEDEIGKVGSSNARGRISVQSDEH
jgi:hypothetical protein